MFTLHDRSVLVIGLGASGVAACGLLGRHGARVAAVDAAESDSLRRQARALSASGVRVQLGANAWPDGRFDLVVVSPGVPESSPLLQAARAQGVPVIGELELGYQQAACLSLAVTGTNGKTTTTELLEHLLQHTGRRTLAAGNIGRPLCSVVEQTRELDLLTLEVSSFQLETIQYFRPVIAAFMNLTPDHLDRYRGMREYALAKARIFMNQQAFDWAIIQREAWLRLSAYGVSIPSKTVTFSAADPSADLFADRGMLISRLPDWQGPLLDMDDCQLRGPHNAENVMAALAVGHVLRIPLEQMVPALKSYAPAPHRCEFVAEIAGVKYYNDSKATNVDAVEKALLTVPTSQPAEPNVWLIAGGKDKGLEFHDLGPVLARRVKGAFLIGEMAPKIHAAWGLFTPCTVVRTLLEAVTEAAHHARAGDVVLLSPACSSFDMFRDYQHRGEVFREAVAQLARPSGSGSRSSAPSSSGPPEDEPVGASMVSA